MVSSNNGINNKVGASISGVTNTFTITNPSNTASSASRSTISVGGGSSGDPSLNFNVNAVTDWEMGIDNSDSDKLKISQGTSLGTNDTWIMTTAGERTMPLQPAFLAYLNTTTSNVTGDGTEYTIVYDTEVFDQNSDFNGTTTFTAPITGRYYFTGSVRVSNLTSANNNGFVAILTSNRNYESFLLNWATARSAPGVENVVCSNYSFFVDMDASDTAMMQVSILNGAKVSALDGLGGNYVFNSFSGFLVC